MAGALRGMFGYCFLVLMVRVAGRRPGKQMAPFEFVLIFFMGGLTLTPMVGDDESLTNAIITITAIAITHFAISWLKHRSPRFGRIVDGTPLILLKKGEWQVDTMRRMRLQDDDVMSMARDQGRSTRSITRSSSATAKSASFLLRRAKAVSMAAATKPVEDTSPKVNEEVAVGEDLDFQRAWWRAERGIWVFFLLLIIADLLGVFGRG